MSERVWVCQCLCAEGHCLMAAAGVLEDEPEVADKFEAKLRAVVGLALASGAINPWCGLCHSPLKTWKYQTEATSYATMEEARPVLQRYVDEQNALAALFGDIPRSD